MRLIIGDEHALLLSTKQLFFKLGPKLFGIGCSELVLGVDFDLLSRRAPSRDAPQVPSSEKLVRLTRLTRRLSSITIIVSSILPLPSSA